MAKPKTVAIEDYDALNRLLMDDRKRHQHELGIEAKRAEDNSNNAQGWRSQLEELQSTLKKSREDFASLKEHTHRLEMQLSRLEGYRDHVREVADSQRAPIETHIIEPSTAPRMQARAAKRDSANGMVMTATEDRRRADRWFNY